MTILLFKLYFCTQKLKQKGYIMAMGQKILYNYGTMDYLIKYKIYSSPECKKRQKGEFEEKKSIYNYRKYSNFEFWYSKIKIFKIFKTRIKKKDKYFFNLLLNAMF